MGKSSFDPFRRHGQLQQLGAGGIKHGIGYQRTHTNYGRFTAFPLSLN